MYDAQWNINEANALVEKLRALPINLRGKAGRSAAGKSMKLLKDAAAALWKLYDRSWTANDISKNVTQRADGRFMRQTGDVKISVGILGGARDYSAYGEITQKGKQASDNAGGDTFYWRFLEFGTIHIKAREVMQTVFDNELSAIENKFANEMDLAIQRILKKQGIAT